MFGAHVTGLAQRTSTVTVVNTDAQPVPVKGTVKVENVGSNPLLVRDLDKLSRIPYQKGSVINMDAIQGSGFATFEIPEGYMVVVEYVSANAFTLDGSSMIKLYLSTFNIGGGFFQHHLEWKRTESNPSLKRYVASAPVRMYGKTGLDVLVEREGGTGAVVGPVQAVVHVSVGGYLVPLP